jgi:hypothetical protein
VEAKSSRGADEFRIVIRETDWVGEGPVERAVLVDAGGALDLPLEEFVSEAARWIHRARGDHFTIKTERTYVSVGASGDVAQLMITFLGATAGGVASRAIYDGLLELSRRRLLPDRTERESTASYLRGLPEADVARILSDHLALAIDARRSEPMMVELVIDDGGLRGVYDVVGQRYEVSVEEDVYRIARVTPP